MAVVGDVTGQVIPQPLGEILARALRRSRPSHHKKERCRQWIESVEKVARGLAEVRAWPQGFDYLQFLTTAGYHGDPRWEKKLR